MKLEAMFFDFDGVVADTETAWMNCVCEYCEDEGIPIDREQLLSYAGRCSAMSPGAGRWRRRRSWRG